MPAMQGTGRMALFGGLHPAQLKDSVTSTLPYPLAKTGVADT